MKDALSKNHTDRYITDGDFKKSWLARTGEKGFIPDELKPEHLQLVESTDLEAESFDVFDRVVKFNLKRSTAKAPSVIETETGRYIYGEKGNLVGADKIIHRKGEILDTEKHVIEIATEFKNNKATKQIRLTENTGTGPSHTTLDVIATTISADGKTIETIMNRREVAPGQETHTVQIETTTQLDSKKKATKIETIIKSPDPFFLMVGVVTDHGSVGPRSLFSP